MPMQQQLPPLPFSAEIVYTPNMAQGLPHNPTCFPNVPLSPNMNQFGRMICGYTMKELQDNASKNNLRVFSFNLFSANNWMTKEFAQLVAMVADYAEILVAFNSLNVEAAIAGSASSMVTWMTAVLPSMYPALMNYVTQDMHQDLQNLMNSFTQATQQIQQYKQRSQQPQQQPQGWQNNQPQYVNQNNGFGGNFNVQPMPANNGGGGFGVSMGPSNPAPVAGMIPGSGMFSNAPQAPAVNTGMGSISMAPSMGSFAEENRQATVTDIGFSPNAAPVIVTVDNTPKKKLPDRTEFLGMKLAFLPETELVKRKWVPDSPYSFAFNKNTHVMFLNMVDNVSAFEVIKPVSEVGVEYINHELDTNFQLKAHQNSLPVNRNIPANWDKMNEAIRTKDIEANESRDKDFEFDKSVLMHERHCAGSLAQAIEIAKMRLEGKNIKLSENAPFEFTYREVHPFYLDDKYAEVIKELKPTIKEIFTYADAYSFLKTVNGMLPSEVWDYLNDRLTTALNRELEIGMGLKLTIDSFFLDIHATLDWLEKKGAGVKTTFLTTQQEVVGTVFKMLVGDGLKNYITSIGGTFTEETEFKHLIFFEDFFVVLVPWVSAKLDIAMHEKYAAIMESYFPDLFPALKHMVDKSNVQKIYRRLIITSDGVKIDVSEGTFSKDIYIISRV